MDIGDQEVQPRAGGHEASGGRGCATMVAHERLLRSDPSYVQARVASENHHWQAVTEGTPAGRPGVTVIAVVVHVVWKTDSQNIDTAQIQSQVDALNHDYRKTNSDIGSIPSVFAPLAADARVEFELASTDPDGNPTDGVTRTQTSVDSFTFDNAVKHASSGGADGWPSDAYLNIWVCELAFASGGMLLGYAQFPGGPPATDGIAIKNTAFGTTGTVAPPFHLGRCTTNQVGHWLNLHHIWGNDGTGCHSSDFVADTPNAAQPNSGKPAFPHVSCANSPHGDMFMNFMDSTDDDAMFMFTHGQVERMQVCLAHDRPTVGRGRPL